MFRTEWYGWHGRAESDRGPRPYRGRALTRLRRPNEIRISNIEIGMRFRVSNFVHQFPARSAGVVEAGGFEPLTPSSKLVLFQLSYAPSKRAAIPSLRGLPDRSGATRRRL